MHMANLVHAGHTINKKKIYKKIKIKLCHNVMWLLVDYINVVSLKLRPHIPMR